MFKAYYLSTLVAFSLTTTLGAWGHKAPMHQVNEPVDDHFPLHPKQAWALEESLLVWKTYEDDTDYAVRRVLTTLPDSSQRAKQTIKHPTFDWNTGVRVKLTRYLPSNDPWDVNLIGTYFYDQAESDRSVNFILGSSSQDVLISTWDTTGAGFASKARASTKMNFFTIDLTAGRYYSLTRKINIHPFIGIRTALNYQDYKASFINPSSNPSSENPRFKGEFDFWGVGPRIGTDIALRFGRHWSLLGTFGASLFGGRYEIDQTFTGASSLVQNGATYHEKITDKDTVLRSNIDASLGLGWEKWVRKKTVCISPSFVFEVSEWFSMKRWVDSHFYTGSFSSGSDPVIYPHRRYSDLGLMGFNINLKVDF